jgi:hypothetical protein
MSVEIPVEQAAPERGQGMVYAATAPYRLHQAGGTQCRGVLGGGRRTGARAGHVFVQPYYAMYNYSTLGLK